MDERAVSLRDKIWATMGARFNAHRRLIRQHYAATFTTAMLSSYVVFIQLAPWFLKIDTNREVLTLLTAFLATSILILSLVEQARSREVRAERLHTCAMKLNLILDRLNNALECVQDPEKAIRTASEEYHQVLACVSENHDPIDHAMFKVQEASYYTMKWRTITFVRIRYVFLTYGVYFILAVGMPIVFLQWVI